MRLQDIGHFDELEYTINEIKECDKHIAELTNIDKDQLKKEIKEVLIKLGRIKNSDSDTPEERKRKNKIRGYELFPRLTKAKRYSNDEWVEKRLKSWIEYRKDCQEELEELEE